MLFTSFRVRHNEAIEERPSYTDEKLPYVMAY